MIRGENTHSCTDTQGHIGQSSSSRSHFTRSHIGDTQSEKHNSRNIENHPHKAQHEGNIQEDNFQEAPGENTHLSTDTQGQHQSDNHEDNIENDSHKTQHEGNIQKNNSQGEPGKNTHSCKQSQQKRDHKTQKAASYERRPPVATHERSLEVRTSHKSGDNRNSRNTRDLNHKPQEATGSNRRPPVEAHERSLEDRTQTSETHGRSHFRNTWDPKRGRRDHTSDHTSETHGRPHFRNTWATTLQNTPKRDRSNKSTPREHKTQS